MKSSPNTNTKKFRNDPNATYQRFLTEDTFTQMYSAPNGAENNANTINRDNSKSNMMIDGGTSITQSPKTTRKSHLLNPKYNKMTLNGKVKQISDGIEKREMISQYY